MKTVSFAVRTLELLENILDRMENVEALDDLDMDLVDGVLKVESVDGRQIIINRQEPLEQVWMASPLGPAHFYYEENRGEWLDERTGVPLIESLEAALGLTVGSEVRLQD